MQCVAAVNQVDDKTVEEFSPHPCSLLGQEAEKTPTREKSGRGED